MTDQEQICDDEWPDTVWLTEIDHEYAPNGFYYLAQPDGGVPYFHGQILTRQREYFVHMKAQFRTALADAIRRPMGVIPASAEGLVSQADLDLAEARRPPHPIP